MPSEEAFKFRRGQYFWHTRALSAKLRHGLSPNGSRSRSTTFAAAASPPLYRTTSPSRPPSLLRMCKIVRPPSLELIVLLGDSIHCDTSLVIFPQRGYRIKPTSKKKKPLKSNKRLSLSLKSPWDRRSSPSLLVALLLPFLSFPAFAQLIVINVSPRDTKVGFRRPRGGNNTAAGSNGSLSSQRGGYAAPQNDKKRPTLEHFFAICFGLRPT